VKNRSTTKGSGKSHCDEQKVVLGEVEVYQTDARGAGKINKERKLRHEPEAAKRVGLK